MIKRRFKQISEGDFKNIKLLCDAGLSVRQIRDITGRGTATIGVIKKSSSLDSYLDEIRSHYNKQNATKEPSQEAKETTPLASRLDRVIDLLEEISSKVTTGGKGLW